MDLKPCNSVVAYVGQDMLCFTTPTSCNTPRNDTRLHVFRHDGTALAIYEVHGIDANGMCFYIDSSINATAGNYTYQLHACGSIVSSGTLVVTESRQNYKPKAPSTRCQCEGC